MVSSALSNSSPLFSLHSPSTPRSPSQTPKPLKIVSFPLLHQNPSPAIALSLQLTPRPSRLSLRVAGTDPKTTNGVEEDQGFMNQPENNEDQENFHPMKVLVQAYKKAILNGDEKSVYEIESKIGIMENEKNKLSLKFGELTAEIASGKDKFLRLKADFENFRKHTEKDRLTFTSDVQGDVIESLLPLVDSFERAKQHMKPVTEKEKKIDTSYQGIYKQFVEIMRSLCVSVVGTIGKPFDPSIHEAIGREESQKFKEGVVTEEVRRGFILGDRLLRPATVKVSIGPGPGKVPLATGKSSSGQTRAEAAEAV